MKYDDTWHILKMERSSDKEKIRETILHSLPYFNQVIPVDSCFLWQFKSCPDDQPFYLGYPEFATFGGNKALPV